MQNRSLIEGKVALTLAATIAAGATLPSFAAESKRPNILFIITDDQDPATLGTYGDTACDTPVLDKLASEGVTLTDAHQMGSFVGAVSTASRTMIMTGKNVWNAQQLRKGMNKYQQNFGNVDNAPADSPEYNSLPAVFHRAGYETYRTCKAGNSYEPANAMFDKRKDKVCREGNDEKGSKWHADNVIEYLDNKSNDKPFFIYLGFSHPHDPRHGKPELLEKYGAEDIPTPIKINAATPPLPLNWLPEKPFFDGHPNLRDECKVFGVMDRRDEVTVRNEIGKEYACIENVDIQIGRVLEALERSGELENTYIFFTADHGIAVGKHAFMGKQNLYEHTFRVPLIVKGPGVPADTRKSGYTYLMDILPTLCDFAGFDAPSELDGESFKEVVMGDKESVRESVYGVYSGGTKPGIRCVKSDGWKLIKYDVMDGAVRETQLFNLNDNPEELMIEHHSNEVVAATGNKPKKGQVDLAEDKRYSKKLAEMEALLLDEMNKQGDPYRLWNQE
ncbi:MAG: sulfatase-like hydrolase/transferase [Rikenellaceae bacterium]